MNIRNTAVKKCAQPLEHSLAGEEPTDRTADWCEHARPDGEEGEDWTVWKHLGEESDSAMGN